MVDDDAELWEKHAEELIRFATALVGPFDSEDVLSSAFIAAITSPSWPTVVNRRAYLFRSVSNTAHNMRRSRAHRSAREQLVADREEAGAVTEVVEAMSMLERLTVRQRGVIWMSYWLDAPDREIAELLGVSLRTVERELRSARRTLERELR